MYECQSICIKNIWMYIFTHANITINKNLLLQDTLFQLLINF